MHHLRASITRFFIHLIGLMPLGFARVIGVILGKLSWWFKDRGAIVTLDNLVVCFPELSKSERARLAKKSLCETYKIAGETFLLWQRGNSWVPSKTAVTLGGELLQAPLARGQGVIVAIPHLGNWEFLGATLPAYAKPTCMYQPPKKPWLENVVKEKRESLGMTLVPTNSKGVAAQLRALKSGEIVAILPDQVPADESGMYSPFFGMPALSMTLIHGLIQRTHCKVVMGVAKRVNRGFELHFLAPDEEIYSEDKQQSVDALNRSIEKCVQLCLTQYQWEYKRFKRQPHGDAPYNA